MKQFYKNIFLLLSLLFALVGAVFLFLPDDLLGFFNAISRSLGMMESPMQGAGLFHSLAVAYMYLVAWAAYRVSRRPENGTFIWLLINAKGASSLISLFSFLVFRPYLILLTNFIVDGFIAIALVFLAQRMKKGVKA